MSPQKGPKTDYRQPRKDLCPGPRARGFGKEVSPGPRQKCALVVVFLTIGPGFYGPLSPKCAAKKFPHRNYHRHAGLRDLFFGDVFHGTSRRHGNHPLCDTVGPQAHSSSKTGSQCWCGCSHRGILLPSASDPSTERLWFARPACPSDEHFGIREPTFVRNSIRCVVILAFLPCSGLFVYGRHYPHPGGHLAICFRLCLSAR